MECRIKRLEPLDHVAETIEGLSYLIDQQHTHALRQRLPQACQRVHRIPSHRRCEPLNQVDRYVRVSAFDLADVFLTQVSVLG